MSINHLFFSKLQSSLQLPAALLRVLAAAAHPLPERPYRPLFPLRAEALAEAAAAQSAKSAAIADAPAFNSADKQTALDRNALTYELHRILDRPR